jgi:hypothetical protein
LAAPPYTGRVRYMTRSACLASKAGEGGRTLDIHVGNVTLYH